jgi:polar amino acid transport system ATP-binding protein
MSFLEIRGVEKYFGRNHVLRGIDLDVDEHNVICLIGASGSGKSTLLRCINGLESIQEGTIVVGGRTVTQEEVNLNFLRRNIGIVFQSFNLFPHMNVLKNVTLAPRKVLCLTKDEAEERARVLLERIGLWEKALEFPDRLSGGEQQRVAIVRALAMQPRLILLDEVTSALDPELTGEVLAMVRELKDEGMTMLLATHEMGFARECANRVAFLDQGVLLEQGPPNEIFRHPQHPRTQAFLKRVVDAGRL